MEKKVSSMAAREFKYFFLRLGPDNTELLNRCISYDDEMRSSHAQITTFHCHGKPLTSSPIQFIALKLITNNIKGSLVEQNFFYHIFFYFSLLCIIYNKNSYFVLSLFITIFSYLFPLYILLIIVKKFNV